MTETIADECLRSTIERLDKAIGSLGRVVVERCPGYDELARHSRKNMRDAYFTLIEIVDSLKGR